MDRVKGHSDDMLIVRGVNLFPSQIEEILLQDERLSQHYYLEVRWPDRLDELAVIVEAKSVATDGETHVAAGRDLARRIKLSISISSEVTVAEPGTIERSAGKARRVVDLRPEGQ